jgi:transcriptional regulator with XRE-family HTH domain
MSGHHPFDELRARTPEQQELVAAYERSIRAALALRDLRARSGITQGQLAKRMAVSQEFVSKLERGTDPRLSSVTRYVQAMGGEVTIVVALPNQEPVDLAVPPRHEPATTTTRRRRQPAAVPS